MKRQRKKLLRAGAIFVVILLVFTVMQSSVLANSINGKSKSINRYYLDDISMVSLRDYEESLGNKVNWNSKTKEITVKENGQTLYETQAGSEKIVSRGREYTLTIPVTLRNGVTYVEESVLDSIHNKINTLSYEFESSNCGFTPIFADYHDDGQNYESYEMKSDYVRNTVSGDESMSLYISSSNRSDDMFMGYVKKIHGLKPNSKYSFNVSFNIATNIEGGMIGIGGSPGESVYVKCGVVGTELKTELDKLGNIRLNIDHGSQSQGGEDMIVVGDMVKPLESGTEGFVFKEMYANVETITDENGCAYLVISTDSGFEGLTEYYIDNVTINYILN